MNGSIKKILTPLLDVVPAFCTGPRVIVLCYHSIDPSCPYWSTPPDQFEEHLRWLTSNCDLIRFSELLNWQFRRASVRPAVAITFDDGYRDNYEHAFPILVRHGATATFFLITGYIEKSEAARRNLERWRSFRLDWREPMSWSQIKEMRQSGMDFGSHTATHPNLARLKPSQVLEELVTSRQTMEDRLGEQVLAMAYPFGVPGKHFAGETQALVAEAGYEMAGAILYRPVKENDSRLRLPRFSVKRDALRTLQAKVAGRWDIVGLWQDTRVGFHRDTGAAAAGDRPVTQQPRFAGFRQPATQAGEPAGQLCELESKSERQLLTTLFWLLEEAGVRYCVLHSYDTLPEYSRSDVDMAVHPDDDHLLSTVMLSIRQSGYSAVQCLNYAVGSDYFVFAWQEGFATRTLALDVTREHREGGTILARGSTLVAGRRKLGEFWVASAEVGLSYLLAKKILKGEISDAQSGCIRELIVELGTERSVEIAARLFGKSGSSRAVEVCLDGLLSRHLGVLRRRFWLNLLLRRPWNPILCVVTDIPRVIRRWCSPTGLFVAVLGPDGVGKSTMIERLAAQVKTAFRSHRLFHWRPMLLGANSRRQREVDPRDEFPLPVWRSVIRVFAHLADYQLGYWIVIRRLLAHSCLVLFDRYSQDAYIDPARLRYSGPRWVARALCRLVPQPDLLIVLDAPEDVILERNQEASRESIAEKRAAYRALADGSSSAALIDASRGQDQVAADAAGAVLGFLARRFERVHRRWLG